MKRFPILLATLLGLAILAGCASTTTGAITIDFTGLASSVSGEALVTGPGGYSQSVSGDQTITGLTAGSYTVTASSVLGDESVVPYVYSPSPTSTNVSVSGGVTANVTVSYGQKVGSGRLWQPDDGDPIIAGFDRSLLLSSGAPTPTALISGDTGPVYEAVVFDAEGNAWVSAAFGTTDALLKYSATDLVSTGSPSASVTITTDGGSTASLADPIGLAFDSSGNLWVAAYASDRLEMYTPSQLSSSGNPTPDTVVTSASISDPIGLAFDASGNLWVSNQGTSEVVGFTSAQLSAGGSQSAEVVLSTDGSGSLAQPFGLAFDSNDNLWVVNFGNGNVVRFASSQLASTGSPTPVASIQAATFTATGATGVALDHDGNLWVNHTTSGHTLSKIENPAALSGSVTTTVAVEITTAFGYDVGLPAFYPVPPSSPIVAP